MRCVGDLEADGLLQAKKNKKGEILSLPATVIWCGVFTNIDTGKTHEFGPDELDAMCLFLDEVDELVGHNFVDYDIPLMESILDYKFFGKIFDTLIVSQMTCPDRVGGHGLDNWGRVFGVPKPKHEDWSKFSPEMLHRCKEDVKINVLVYEALLKELNGDPTGLDFTFKN